MRTTEPMTITLPIDMAAVVREKINSGQYASASEVMRDGLRALMERDAAVEKWLREEVVAGHAEYLADPSKGIPADQILDRIKLAVLPAKAPSASDLHTARRTEVR